MSTDYSARCIECRKQVHFGQRMGPGFSVAFGSLDGDGRARLCGWLLEHLGEGHDVRIVHAEDPCLFGFADETREVYDGEARHGS